MTVVTAWLQRFLLSRKCCTPTTAPASSRRPLLERVPWSRMNSLVHLSPSRTTACTSSKSYEHVCVPTRPLYSAGASWCAQRGCDVAPALRIAMHQTFSLLTCIVVTRHGSLTNMLTEKCIKSMLCKSHYRLVNMHSSSQWQEVTRQQGGIKTRHCVKGKKLLQGRDRVS